MRNRSVSLVLTGVFLLAGTSVAVADNDTTGFVQLADEDTVGQKDADDAEAESAAPQRLPSNADGESAASTGNGDAAAAASCELYETCGTCCDVPPVRIYTLGELFHHCGHGLRCCRGRCRHGEACRCPGDDCNNGCENRCKGCCDSRMRCWLDSHKMALCHWWQTQTAMYYARSRQQSDVILSALFCHHGRHIQCDVEPAGCYPGYTPPGSAGPVGYYRITDNGDRSSQAVGSSIADAEYARGSSIVQTHWADDQANDATSNSTADPSTGQTGTVHGGATACYPNCYPGYGRGSAHGCGYRRGHGGLLCSGCGGYGCGLCGGYDLVYALNPQYFDRRDGRVYAAQGYGVPVTVPLAPTVDYQFNYGWGIPSSRITPISRTTP